MKGDPEKVRVAVISPSAQTVESLSSSLPSEGRRAAEDDHHMASRSELRPGPEQELPVPPEGPVGASGKGDPEKVRVAVISPSAQTVESLSSSLPSEGRRAIITWLRARNCDPDPSRNCRSRQKVRSALPVRQWVRVAVISPSAQTVESLSSSLPSEGRRARTVEERVTWLRARNCDPDPSRNCRSRQKVRSALPVRQCSPRGDTW
jgi:molybdopterin converting factor small subunit